MDLKPGIKYCDFCGRKVPVELQSGRPAGGDLPRALGNWALVALAVGALVFTIHGLGKKKPSPAPPPGGGDINHRVSAACESAIRQQARGPFRVIAFRSTLVSEEQRGYVVSGSVDLQSAAGDLQRKRYFCRFHRDDQAGLVLDEGKTY